MIYIIQSNLSIIYMYIHDNIITSATLKYAELPRLCKLPMELLLAKLPNDKGGGDTVMPNNAEKLRFYLSKILNTNIS